MASSAVIGADVVLQVAAAGAVAAADAGARAVDQHGHLLRARAGRGHHAHRARARTTLAKPSARPSRIAVPGAGAHHEQPELVGAPLERDLVGDRHAVAEEQDVHPGAERLVGLERGVLAGHGDDRDVAAGAARLRGARGARRGRPPRPGHAVEHLLGGREAGAGVVALDGDHEVVGPGRVDRRRREPEAAPPPPGWPACP